MRSSRHAAQVAATLITISLSGGALADCGALSRYGLYDVSSSMSDTQRSLSFRRLFCQQNFETASDASNFGLSLGLPIGDLPVELGIDSSNQSFRESYSRFCDDQSYDSTFRQRTENLIRRINPTVVQALQACLTQRGLHAWIEQGADGLSFRFKTVFVPASSDDPIPQVNNFRVQGATCDDPPATNSRIGPQGYETLCRRPSDANAVAISFNASSFVNADTPLSLAPIVHPTPPPPRQRILIRAVDFTIGRDVAPANGLAGPDGSYGEVLLNAPDYRERPNWAEWRFEAPGGRYRLDVQYAAAAARPVRILVNGVEWRGSALSEATGCWADQCQAWREVGTLNLRPGENTTRFERSSVFPHLKTLRFVPIN